VPLVDDDSPDVIRRICSGRAVEPVHLIVIVSGVPVLQTTRARSTLSPSCTVGISVANPTSASYGGTGWPRAATVLFNDFAVRVPGPASTAIPAGPAPARTASAP
jgi:hypothetical protein